LKGASGSAYWAETAPANRAFLKKVANRIMELDRGRLVAYDCDYGTYLERRQAAMEAKEKQRSEFDKKLAKEETWIRQGLKARRKRNEGRVRALEKMREARRARRNEVDNVNLQVQQAEKTGKLVIEARSIRAAGDGSADGSQGRTHLVSDFSTVIMRGDRVGIIGPNGAGKTTLLQILLKQAAPDDGHVRHGHGLRVAYFDQLRAGLDENRTVSENIGEGNDFIVFNGEKRHVISYLKDFLFTPERWRTPVHILSGGEKNRLLLARLFTRPTNVLVMDEPTNDLGIETLELLEDMLFHFQGTVLVVSHDRAFLNNVVTCTIVFEGQGEVIEYAGGYDDWLIQRAKRQKDMPAEKKEKPSAKPAPSEKPRGNRPPKLGSKEKRELEALPAKIEEMETECDALYAQMAEPEFYKTDKDEIVRVKARMEELEKAIEYAYDRWEALEGGV
jgi:ATP-binding cassette subfamily F protein uup